MRLFGQRQKARDWDRNDSSRRSRAYLCSDGTRSQGVRCKLFSALTVVVMGTTFIAPPLLKLVFPPKPTKITFRMNRKGSRTLSISNPIMTRRLGPHDVSIAADLLRCGATVVIPTETVYGLAADATNAAAIEKIFVAKGRPSDNPLIAHLYSPDQLDRYCHSIPEIAYRLMERFCLAH